MKMDWSKRKKVPLVKKVNLVYSLLYKANLIVSQHTLNDAIYSDMVRNEFRAYGETENICLQNLKQFIALKNKELLANLPKNVIIVIGFKIITLGNTLESVLNNGILIAFNLLKKYYLKSDPSSINFYFQTFNLVPRETIPIENLDTECLNNDPFENPELALKRVHCLCDLKPIEMQQFSEVNHTRIDFLFDLGTAKFMMTKQGQTGISLNYLDYIVQFSTDQIAKSGIKDNLNAFYSSLIANQNLDRAEFNIF